MFILRNTVGNVIRKVKTERERDRLIDDGYVLVDNEEKAKGGKKKAAEDGKAGDAQ